MACPARRWALPWSWARPRCWSRPIPDAPTMAFGSVSRPTISPPGAFQPSDQPGSSNPGSRTRRLERQHLETQGIRLDTRTRPCAHPCTARAPDGQPAPGHRSHPHLGHCPRSLGRHGWLSCSDPRYPPGWPTTAELCDSAGVLPNRSHRAVPDRISLDHKVRFHLLNRASTAQANHLGRSRMSLTRLKPQGRQFDPVPAHRSAQLSEPSAASLGRTIPAIEGHPWAIALRSARADCVGCRAQRRTLGIRAAGLKPLTLHVRGS
jgi:hypothetical protein